MGDELTVTLKVTIVPQRGCIVLDSRDGEVLIAYEDDHRSNNLVDIETVRYEVEEVLRRSSVVKENLWQFERVETAE
jgi:hypothetical protein